MTTETVAPYGIVLRVAKAYEEERQLAVSSYYRSLDWANDPMADKNWIHFERSATLMMASGCQDETEWISAQFRTATATHYPYPTNLYSEQAVQNYLDMAEIGSDSGRVTGQLAWLEQYRHLFPDRSDTEIVLNPLWAFDSWFRTFYAETVAVVMAADAQQELMQSTSLRREITSAGLDLTAIEAKIQGYL